MMIHKSKSPLMTGLTTGVVIGAAAYMVVKKTHQHHRPRLTTRALRKKTGRALHTVGSVIENMAYLVQ